MANRNFAGWMTWLQSPKFDHIWRTVIYVISLAATISKLYSSVLFRGVIIIIQMSFKNCPIDNLTRRLRIRHEEKLEEDQIVSFWGCFPGLSSTQENSTHTYVLLWKITPKAKKKRIITKGSQTENNCQTLLGDSNRFTHMIGVEWKCKRGLGFVGLGLVMNLQPLLGDWDHACSRIGIGGDDH